MPYRKITFKNLCIGTRHFIMFLYVAIGLEKISPINDNMNLVFFKALFKALLVTYMVLKKIEIRFWDDMIREGALKRILFCFQTEDIQESPPLNLMACSRA